MLTQPDLIHLVGTAAFILAIAALCASIGPLNSWLGLKD